MRPGVCTQALSSKTGTVESTMLGLLPMLKNRALV